MDDTLTADELRAITGKAQAKSQAAALARLGLPFRFTGRAVLLERAIARAHELLPQHPAISEPEPQRTRGLNAGLAAWQGHRNANRDRADAASQLPPEVAAAIRAKAAEARAIRSKALAAERGRLRKEAERKQTPAWADRALTLAVYEEAARITKQTGIPHQVDHEVPLRGRLVSGLHVHQNLRVITAAENRKKLNRFDPC